MGSFRLPRRSCCVALSSVNRSSELRRDPISLHTGFVWIEVTGLAGEQI